MGSPFSFALSTHAISLWGAAEGSIKVCYRLHVSGQKGIAEWVSSCPEGCGPSLRLYRVSQSSPKPCPHKGYLYGTLSIKYKSNADLDSSVGSGPHLKDSVDNALCAFSTVRVCVCVCICIKKEACGRGKN